jgi:putative DNA primase/helicase
MVIPFLNSFRDRAADERRGTRLLAELPGIFNWMLDGVKRLYRQRSFTACDVCSEWAEKHRFDSDPFQQFSDAHVVLEPSAVSIKEALYGKYQEYCVDNGRKAQSSTHFYQQVLKLDGVSERRPGSGARRPRAFVGIRLGQQSELRPAPCPASKSRSLKRKSRSLEGRRSAS